MRGIIPFAHQILREHLYAGGIAVDGTAGRGRDTLLLAQCAGDAGKVYAFDVQAAALAATAQLLDGHGLRHRVQLLHTGHQYLPQHVPPGIAAAVFNFGYLPGGDKTLTTRADTSVAAFRSALDLLAAGGAVVAVLYPGHEAGALEAQALLQLAQSLPPQDFDVVRYAFENRPNRPPFVLAAEKTAK